MMSNQFFEEVRDDEKRREEKKKTFHQMSTIQARNV